MEEVRGQVTEDVIKLFLAGHIDSNNAAAAEAEIASILGDAAARPMVIDASDLVYISSAGLRMILRLRKKYEDLTITGVNSEIYEILEIVLVRLIHGVDGVAGPLVVGKHFACDHIRFAGVGFEGIDIVLDVLQVVLHLGDHLRRGIVHLILEPLRVVGVTAEFF